jgi:hypothetical protein
LNLERLIERGEAFHQELGREYYLTGSGLKAEPEFEALYQRFADLLTDEALEVGRASGQRPLWEWLVGLRAGRLVAPLEERQLRWEQQAVVRAAGIEAPYLEVPIRLANEPDRARRLALDAARAELVAAELNPLLRERLALEHRAFREAGLADYVSGWEQVSGIAVRALGQASSAFLVASEALYQEVLARLIKRRIGVSLEELARADVAWAFRARQYDAAFPLEELLPRALRQMEEMGLDAHRSGRVRWDTEERPRKQPRAFCAPVRVPEEIYLVLRPRGGHQDYRTFWHELGHALHFASVDPGRPFADRWVGDNSVTEGFAMLWDHVTLELGWLERYAGLSERQARELRYELLVHDLYSVRRYAAKLTYELLLHGDTGAEQVSDEYARRLTAATGFRYYPADYLQDVDPLLYAARYVRAWQFEAALAEELVRRFDEDWYRNPRAGPFIQDLMSRGQADLADRLVAEVTGAPLSFEPLLQRLERNLQ